MPSKGTSKRTVKTCLVCGGITSVAHLGIDLCRACSIFYRRFPKRRARSCRANTNQCPPGKGLNCKKCRFEWIERALKQKPRSLVDSVQYTPTEQYAAEAAVPIEESRVALPQSPQYSDEPSIPLLERLRLSYRSMCHTRMIAEMHARGDPPHPLLMDVDAPPTFPATCKSMQSSNKILLASLLEFGKASFPEFAGLPDQEKFNIVTEFFYRFRTFEGCFRANSVFPEHPTRFLPSYTSFLSPEVYVHFYEEFSQNVDLESAWRYIKNSNFNINEVPAGRGVIARRKPHHEEILAVIGLMFWTIDALPPRQELSDIAEKNRKQIMKELHAFYRDKLKLDDYATRLGELLMFIQIFDVKERYQEHFENLRLLNILDDDNFIYRLQKE